MGDKKHDKVPPTAEGGMNVTPGRQDEHRVYERRPGAATAGAGEAGTGPGGPLVTGASEAGRGAATDGEGGRARTEDER